jgi:hypothetical protein
MVKINQVIVSLTGRKEAAVCSILKANYNRLAPGAEVIKLF